MTEQLTSKQILEQESGAYFDLVKKMWQTETFNKQILFDIAFSSNLKKLLGWKNWVIFQLK